ncbi:hypothetical protein [Bacillus altitudinis]|uniref:hypothetical protein n=1 Tax=Bacillus altitudinis TaxID=293387 RepID=UPI0024A906F2|nr:hypothetical protein [Bacillus altitudinis]WHF25236.1 hypothetical protein QJS65_10275 [Bacillus altitudinis]
MIDQERVIKDVLAFTERNEEERMFDGFKSYINKIKHQRDRLRMELKKYKSDEKIKELENEIEELRAKSVFIFSENEKKEEIQFKKEHREKCNSGIYYFFEETEFGIALDVKCRECGLKKDITDYSRW